MLRIGFDAKRAFLNNTGLGNYSRSVITSLASFYPENRYFLYTPEQKENARTLPLLNIPDITIRTPRLPVFKSAWRSRFVTGTLAADKLDIYHGLSHEIPSGIGQTGIKTVVTIHDLIFLRYPQYYKAIDRKIYTIKFRNACAHADRIIAISEQTKRDIIHYFGTDPEKISVVYQSCDPAFGLSCTAEQRAQVKARYGLPDNYLLYVGTIEERKNLMLIVKALPQIPEPFKLVVIGKETAYAQTVHTFIREHRLEQRVIFLPQATFADLPAIYQQAALFVYPSEFEGFGIPLLEALYSGIPAIAATGSCLEEAGGPGSMYVAPHDVAALAEAVQLVLGDPARAQQMVLAGKKYASGFSGQIHADNLMQIYRELLNKPLVI